MSAEAEAILKKMARSDDYFVLEGNWFGFDGGVGLTDAEHALLARLRAEALSEEAGVSGTARACNLR